MFHPNDNAKPVDQRDKPLIGIVINNQDPLQLRRVQVKIEGLMEGVDKNSAPWFRPEASGLGSRSDYGTFDEVPEVNSPVQVTLLDGDLRSGTYKACHDTSVDSSMLRMFGEDYPATSGKCDAKGTFTRKNKKRGYQESMHQSGFYSQVDKEGNLHIYVPGNIFVHVKGGIAMQVDKDFLMKCLGMLGLRSEGDAGISGGGNLEILAGKDISIDSESGGRIDSGLDVRFGVKDKAIAGAESGASKVDARQSEVKALQDAVLLSGEVAKDSIEVHANSLLGTRS